MGAALSQPDQSVLWHEIQSSRLMAHARSSMLAFTRYMNPNYRINWHHRVICDHLDKFVRRDIDRLMIFVEPQSGKSELVSRNLPAFVLGKDPDHRFLAATYGDSFASEFNLDVQAVMDNDKYRAIFPASRIPDDKVRGQVRNSKRFDIMGRGGRYHSVGVGGSLTGKTGYTLCIDDPVKNEEEARSQVYRDRQWRWFKTVARTRLRRDRYGRAPGIILTMTRWHHDDLAGRILAEMKANPHLPQWTILSFPAEREDMSNPLDPRKLGEPLWIENRNSQDLLELKADPRTWNALYMQRPSQEQGSILPRDKWQFFMEAPKDVQVEVAIQSWDLTFTEGKATDFVCGLILGKNGPKRYVLDRFKARVGFNGQITAIQGMWSAWPKVVGKYIEKSANGFAAKQTLDKTIPGVNLWTVKESKIVRAEAHSSEVHAGNWYLPHPSTSSWVLDFIEECAEFPYGKHDDQVDAWSQGAAILANTGLITVSPISISGVSKWNI